MGLSVSTALTRSHPHPGRGSQPPRTTLASITTIIPSLLSGPSPLTPSPLPSQDEQRARSSGPSRQQYHRDPAVLSF